MKEPTKMLINQDWLDSNVVSDPDMDSDIDVVLKSKDGQFKCVGELAVEVAYMMSDCEAYLFENPDAEWEIKEMISEYLLGNLDCTDVQKRLSEWRKEDSE